jgi:integrative and conjugative element protein (TIGR02256 family)
VASAPSDEIAYCTHPDCTYRIGFEWEALSVMWKYRQMQRCSLEAGGQIFCTFSDDGAVIRAVTEPGPTDKRGCFRFVPDRDREIVDIRRHHELGLHYIGDWHTHPQRIPSYSRRDIRSIRECYERSTHSLSAMVLVIVGRVQDLHGVGVWLVNSSVVLQMNWQRVDGSGRSAV